MSDVFTNLQVTPLRDTKNATKASGQVTIGGLVNVRFTVSDGRNGLWVKLPQHEFELFDKESNQKKRAWVKDVRIVDEKLYQELTAMAVSEYQRKVSDGSNGQAQPQATAGDKKPF